MFGTSKPRPVNWLFRHDKDSDNLYVIERIILQTESNGLKCNNVFFDIKRSLISVISGLAY